MKKISFTEILKKSLIIVWNNKKLCWNGFKIFLSDLFLFLVFELNNVTSFSKSVLMISLVVFVFFVFLLPAKLKAIAVLTKSALNPRIYSQATTKSVNYESREYVGKLFFLQLAIILVLWLVLVVLLLPSLYSMALGNRLWAALLFIAAFVFAIFSVLMAFYLKKYAQIFIVSAGISIKDALQMAHDLFDKHAKTSLMLSGTLVLFSLVVFFLIAAIIFVTGLIMLPVILLVYFVVLKNLFVVMIIFGSVFTVEAIIVLSFYYAFMQITWVTFFKEIAFDKSDNKESEEEVDISLESFPNPEAV